MSYLQSLIRDHIEKYGKLFLDDPEERPKYLHPASKEDVRFMLKYMHEQPVYAAYVAGLFWELAREGLLHTPVLSPESGTKNLFFEVLNLRDFHVRRYLVDGVLRAEKVWPEDARALFNTLERHWEDASRVLEYLMATKEAQANDLLKRVLLYCFDHAAMSGDNLTQGRLTWILFDTLFENEDLCMYFFKSVADSIEKSDDRRIAYLSALLLIEYDGWIHREKHWINKFSTFFSDRSDEDLLSLRVIFRFALETSEYGSFIGEHWQWQSLYKSPLFCAIGELLARRGMAPIDLILSQNPRGFEDNLLDLLLRLLSVSPEMEQELRKILLYADNDGNSAWSMLDILVYRASKNEDHEYPEIRSLLERIIPEKIRKDVERIEQTREEQRIYDKKQGEEKRKHVQAMTEVSEGETGHYVWGLLSEYQTDPSLFDGRAKSAVKREIEKLLAWKLFELSREQYPEEGQWLSTISPFCKTLEILRDDADGFFWIHLADVRDTAVRALPFAFDESQRDLLLSIVGVLTPEDVAVVLRPGLLGWKHWIYLWNLLALFRSRTDEFLQCENEVFGVMKIIVESEDLQVWMRELFLDALGSAGILNAHQEWLSELEKACFWEWNYFTDYLSSSQEERDKSLAPLYAATNAWLVSMGDEEAILWHIRQILDADLSVRSIHDEKTKNNGYARLVSGMQWEVEFDRKFIRPLAQLHKLESLAGNEKIQDLLKGLIEKHVRLGEDDADTRLYAIYLGQAALAVFPGIIRDAKNFRGWIDYFSLLESKNERPPSKRVARHYVSRLVDMFWDCASDDEKRRAVRSLVIETEQLKVVETKQLENDIKWESGLSKRSPAWLEKEEHQREVILLVEGYTDALYIEEAAEIFGCKNLKVQNSYWCQRLCDILRDQDTVSRPDSIICGIFDLDEAYNNWNGLKSKDANPVPWSIDLNPWVELCARRKSGKWLPKYALLLPVPNIEVIKRQVLKYISEDEESTTWASDISYGKDSKLSIEMLFYGIHPDINEKFFRPEKFPWWWEVYSMVWKKGWFKDSIESEALSLWIKNAALYAHFKPIFVAIEEVRKDFEKSLAKRQSARSNTSLGNKGQ